MTKKLTKGRREERSFEGVCLGLADYFGWDVAFVRMAFLALTLFGGGVGIGLYLIGMFGMPEHPDYYKN